MDLCTGTCPVLFVFGGNTVSLTSPLPSEQNAVGSISTNEGQTGSAYTVLVTITFLDGTLQAPNFIVSAQA
jgi:hypothetical protein